MRFFLIRLNLIDDPKAFFAQLCTVGADSFILANTFWDEFTTAWWKNCYRKCLLMSWKNQSENKRSTYASYYSSKDTRRVKTTISLFKKVFVKIWGNLSDNWIEFIQHLYLTKRFFFFADTFWENFKTNCN